MIVFIFGMGLSSMVRCEYMDTGTQPPNPEPSIADIRAPIIPDQKQDTVIPSKPNKSWMIIAVFLVLGLAGTGYMYRDYLPLGIGNSGNSAQNGTDSTMAYLEEAPEQYPVEIDPMETTQVVSCPEGYTPNDIESSLLSMPEHDWYHYDIGGPVSLPHSCDQTGIFLPMEDGNKRISDSLSVTFIDSVEPGRRYQFLEENGLLVESSDDELTFQVRTTESSQFPDALREANYLTEVFTGEVERAWPNLIPEQ